MLIGVTVPLWTAKNVTSWHLPFWERDPLRKNGNSVLSFLRGCTRTVLTCTFDKFRVSNLGRSNCRNKTHLECTRVSTRWVTKFRLHFQNKPVRRATERKQNLTDLTLLPSAAVGVTLRDKRVQRVSQGPRGGGLEGGVKLECLPPFINKLKKHYAIENR